MIKHDKFIQFESEDERSTFFKHLKMMRFSVDDNKACKYLITKEIAPLSKCPPEINIFANSLLIRFSTKSGRADTYLHIYKYEDEWYEVSAQRRASGVRGAVDVYFACDEWEGLSNCISGVKKFLVV